MAHGQTIDGNRGLHGYSTAQALSADAVSGHDRLLSVGYMFNPSVIFQLSSGQHC
jgi:hypothetical protein